MFSCVLTVFIVSSSLLQSFINTWKFFFLSSFFLYDKQLNRTFAVEEEERSVSFDMDAAMTRLPSGSWTTLEGQDTMDSLEHEVEKEKEEKSSSTSMTPVPSPSSGNCIFVLSLN